MPIVVAAINAKVEKMKLEDLIEESTLLYALPMVFVNKPDGLLHICIEFRMVNIHIVNYAYLMHQIKDYLDAMAGCTVFITFEFSRVIIS